MIPYLILFSFPAWRALSTRPHVAGRVPQWTASWWVMFVLLVLMVGLRHEVGADWFSYIGYLNHAADSSFFETIVLGDPAYMLLNWLAPKNSLGIYFVNTICAAVFSLGLITFCRVQPRSWLALTVSIPYLVLVVSMGYTRQGTAIGLAMLGLVALSDRKLWHFASFIALAATFHMTAVIMMPLATLYAPKNRLYTILWLGACTALLYSVFLQESISYFQHRYLDAEYSSSGALIRVFMNAVPAAFFLLYRSQFQLSREEQGFWTRLSLIALGFVVLLWASPSTTAVDRVALYLIPLQLFVYSRLPEVFGRASGRGNRLWILAIISYSAIVLFVWLFFADHASAWLPYQFYPSVWYWQ